MRARHVSNLRIWSDDGVVFLNVRCLNVYERKGFSIKYVQALLILINNVSRSHRCVICEHFKV